MESFFESILMIVQRMPSVAWIWVAFLGGSIGSFLNVVAYRLPRAMSLSRPSSHCPHCKSPIRWYDNVPVLGWIRLGGKCRACHQPIAVRYPLVEATMTVVFALTWYVDVGRHASSFDVYGMMSATATYVWHIVTMSVLVCVVLMDIDGQRIPASLFGFCMVVAITISLVHFLETRPVTAVDGYIVRQGEVIRDKLLGLLAAIGIVALLDRTMATTPWLQPSWSTLATAALVGVTLVPVHAAAVVLAASLITEIVRYVKPARSELRLRWATIVAVFTLVGILVS